MDFISSPYQCALNSLRGINNPKNIPEGAARNILLRACQSLEKGLTDISVGPNSRAALEKVVKLKLRQFFLNPIDVRRKLPKGESRSLGLATAMLGKSDKGERYVLTVYGSSNGHIVVFLEYTSFEPTW